MLGMQGEAFGFVFFLAGALVVFLFLVGLFQVAAGYSNRHRTVSYQRPTLFESLTLAGETGDYGRQQLSGYGLMILASIFLAVVVWVIFGPQSALVTISIGLVLIGLYARAGSR